MGEVVPARTSPTLPPPSPRQMLADYVYIGRHLPEFMSFALFKHFYRL